MLTLSGLWKSFGPHVAVADTSMQVGQGDIVALLGPSGSGKTTTLRMIAGFVAPDRGSISVAGRDISRLRPYERNIGVVFQDYALFPHMTVADNIAYGPRRRGVKQAEQERLVERYLGLVRLGGFGGRFPLSLSGGQQQRVALARALAIEPAVLLLDEPLSALDTKLRIEIRGELRDILVAAGCATVIVTHDQEEAMSLADRIYLMNDGRIVQTGAPADIYERPADAFVAGFVGRSNIFAGRIVRERGELRFDGEDGFSLRWPDEAASFGAASFAVRPERVRFGPPQPGENAVAIAAKLMRRLYLGQDEEITVALPGGRPVTVIGRHGEFGGPGPDGATLIHFNLDAIVPLRAAKAPTSEVLS